MKVWIYVAGPHAAASAGGASAAPAAAQRVCWYVGTSDEMVERAVRSQLRLPARARLLLRDADGDLVPVSAALPHDQHFTLVVAPPHPDDGLCAACRSDTSSGAASSDAGAAADGEQRGHRRGRKRALDAAGYSVEALLSPPTLPSTASSVRSGDTQLPPARSVARVVLQFLDVFTRPIADDDNVSFIPSTGRFALYALFCALVEDQRLHPKSKDAFYKMTSMQGKVDRQRAIRYFRAGADAVERYKPQGKGLLLRRYLAVDSASALAAAATSAEPLAAVLERDADETVARYMDFVRGFVPVSKAEYQAHCSRRDAVEHEESD